MATLSARSSFSQLFDQDDPEFLEALRTAVLPGDKPEDSELQFPSAQKRQFDSLSQELKKLSQGTPSTSVLHDSIDGCNESHRRKRAKVDHQAQDLEATDNVPHTPQAATLTEHDVSNAITEGDPDPLSKPTTSACMKQTFVDPSVPSTVPLHTTDPVTFSDAARVPGYAPKTANVHAERLMQNAEFRAAHTSAAGADFIDGFYKNSRLHHLSTWKAELKQLVAEAQERAEKAFILGDDVEGKGAHEVGISCLSEEKADAGPVHVGKVKSEPGMSMRGNAFDILRSPSKSKSKGKAKEEDPNTDMVIMHCDFDCFFASVGILDRPYLKNSPVVVCHSQGVQGGESSTSEVASANYKAREFGIRNGMSLRQARTLCSSVVTIPYEFEKYKHISLQLYTILMSHADDLQAVSVDEALIDVTTGVKQMPVSSGNRNYDPAIAYAEMLRSKIREKTGCEVSIGVSHNIMLARLATRKAKPAGSFHLKLPDLQKFIKNMQIDELHGFGRAIREKAQEKLGETTLGELSRKPRSVLCDALGKTTGETLYNAMRGIDHRKLESDKPRKSVSAEINYGIRFENNEQARAFMFQLSEEVARRLDAIEMRGRSLTLKIMKRDPEAPVEAPKFLGHGCCIVYNKQAPISSLDGRATSDALVIGQQSWNILKGFAFDPKELRGIGIQIQKLEKTSDSRSDRLGQATLDFRKLKKVEKAEHPSKSSTVEYIYKEDDSPSIVVQQPSSQDDEDGIQEVAPPEDKTTLASNLFLPSFSQVDRTAFEALPDEIRDEIKQEYHRRSASPALSAISDGAPSLSPRKTLTTNKGTPLRRITQALAPRNRSSLSSAKHNIFEKCHGQKARIEVTREELKKLGIDPLVFMELPKELQMEQLASARFSKSFRKAAPSKP